MQSQTLLEGQERDVYYDVREIASGRCVRNGEPFISRTGLSVGEMAAGHSVQPRSFWPTDSRTSKMLQRDWPPLSQGTTDYCSIGC